MNREPSCFEHKGMPLAAENAGRMRRTSAPWLQSFGLQPVPGADPTKAFPGAPSMPPEPQMFGSQEGIEPGGARSEVDIGQSKAGNTTPVLQRSTAASPNSSTAGSGNAGGADHRFATASAPGAGSAETVSKIGPRDVSPDAAFSFPNTAAAASQPEVLVQRPGLPVNIPGIAPATQTARVLDSGRPHVAVQKHVKVQQIVSRVVIHQAADAGSSVSTHHMQAVELPGEQTASTEFHTEAIVHTAAGIQVETSSPESRPAAATQTGEMGGGMPVQGPVAMIMQGAPGSHNNRRSPDELLERLNQHNPQHEGGRRVHIRNLHVTVQKPAFAQQQQSAQAAQPQAAPAAAPQTFFNPWERPLSGFD